MLYTACQFIYSRLLAYAFWNLGTAPESGWTHFDKGLDEVFGFLVDSKCFTLLANLFTVGFLLTHSGILVQLLNPVGPISIRDWTKSLVSWSIQNALHCLPIYLQWAL